MRGPPPGYTVPRSQRVKLPGVSGSTHRIETKEHANRSSHRDRSPDASSERLSADEAVREALAANRDLQAARFSIDVARGGLLQAGRLDNPELELGYAATRSGGCYSTDGLRTSLRLSLPDL